MNAFQRKISKSFVVIPTPVGSRQKNFEGSKEEKESLVDKEEKHSNQNSPMKKNEVFIPKNEISGVKQKILQYLAENPKDNPGIDLTSENMIKAMKPIVKPEPKKKNPLLQAILDLRADEEKLKRIQDEADEIGRIEEEKKKLNATKSRDGSISKKNIFVLTENDALDKTEFDDNDSHTKLKQQIYLFLNVPEFSRMVPMINMKPDFYGQEAVLNLR